MNDRKEQVIKKECFRAASILYASLLRERRALRFDSKSAPQEIYNIAMILFNDGKKRYWATYNDMKDMEEESKDVSPHDTDG